jgi:hypothetical protein
MSQNRVLRIFGPKRDEVKGKWRKLHSEELQNLYSVPIYHEADHVKANEVGGACGTHGRGEKIVQGFGGKARRKEITWEDQGLGGRMGLEWILGRLAWGCGLDSIGIG